MHTYDLAIRGGTLVIPQIGLLRADIGIIGETVAAIAATIDEADCRKSIDARGKHVFPGAIDSHFHVGIYRPFSEDARTESAAAASGGVTTILSYFRTGKSYLNKIGPFREIFPELMELSKGSFHTDYAYHLALMTSEQLKEIDWLVRECGVCTFKYYMFYKALDLSGSASSESYLMIKETLDFGFLYRFMKEVSRMNREIGGSGGARLSVHCENPEIIKATNAEVKERPSGNALKDYSDARPSWQEELAIKEVEVIARHTGCPVNLLHLSSRRAVDAGKQARAENPSLDFLLEGTLHHLGMCNENDYGILGKVNPPVRSREDVEYLWSAIANGDIKTVASDHACTTKAFKQGDLWTAMPGFGGTSLMFPLMVTEGYHKRGIRLQTIAETTAYNPAVYHYLYPKKGTIAIGGDADLAIVDIDAEREVTADGLHSAQDFTPFSGMKLKGWPTCTILRGMVIYKDNKVVSEPGQGTYIKRPVKLHAR